MRRQKGPKTLPANLAPLHLPDADVVIEISSDLMIFMLQRENNYQPQIILITVKSTNTSKWKVPVRVEYSCKGFYVCTF